MSSPRAGRAWRTLGTACCAAVLVAACTALAGWWLHIDRAVSVVPGTSPIAPITTVLLSLLAVAVLLAPRSRRGARTTAEVLAAVVGAAALVLMAEYVAGGPFGFESMLFRDRVVELFDTTPGLPSLWTAIALALLSAAAALLPRRRRYAALVGATCLLLVVLVLEFVAVAYVHDALGLIGLFGTKPMSVLTLLLLGLLVIAVMGVEPDRPPLGLAADRADAFVLAWLLPFAFALPIAARVLAAPAAGLGVDPLTAEVLASVVVGLAVGSLVVWLAVARRRAYEAAAAEHRLALELQRFRTAFRAAPSGIVITDADGRIIEANEAFACLVGRSCQELLGMSKAEISHPEDREADRLALEALRGIGASFYRRDKRYVRPDGGTVWVDLSVSPVRAAGGEPLYLVGVVSDLGERKMQEHLLADAATHDPLTGAGNRTVLESWLDRRTVPPPPARDVLVFADLDGFKAVNDAYGHGVGDALLREVARRLTSVVRGDDMVVRLGGDEFVVVVTVAHERDVLPVMERLRRALTGPAVLGGHLVDVSVSLGMAVVDGADARTALACADERMYADKQRRTAGLSAAAHPVAP